MQWVHIAKEKISKLEDKSREINQVKLKGMGRWVSQESNRASELCGTASSGLHLLIAHK